MNKHSRHLVPCFLLWLSFWGCAKPPSHELKQAAETREAAWGAGAVRYAPEELSSFEEALFAAQVKLRQEEHRFFLFRDYQEARAALQAAIEKGRLAAEAARARQKAQEQEAESRIELAAMKLAECQERISSLPASGDLRRDLKFAESLLAESQILKSQGEFTTAAARAGAALTMAELINQRLDKMLDRYRRQDLERRWRSWVDQTIDRSARDKSCAIVVDKLHHACMLFEAGKLKGSFPADLGLNGLEEKSAAGDAATPEGRYKVVKKYGVGQTKYHKALLLDYPNAEDLERFRRAKRLGLIPANSGPGGMIEIHGHGGRQRDWTYGCIALENDDMDKIFSYAEVDTLVTIVGKYLGETKLERAVGSSQRARRRAHSSGLLPPERARSSAGPQSQALGACASNSSEANYEERTRPDD